MDNRDFTATVKEGQVGDPCVVQLEHGKELGIGQRYIRLRLRPGTDIEDAREIARLINERVLSLRVE